MRYFNLFVLVLVSVSLLGCAAQPPTPVPTVAAPTAVPAVAAAPTAAPAKAGTLRYFHILNYDMRSVPLLMAFDDLRVQGYTVQETSLQSSPVIVDALTRGDADVANINNETMWAAIAKGAKVRTFMLAAQTPTFLLAKQEYTSCSQLNGKPVGLASNSGLTPTLLKLYLAKSCPGTNVQIVVLPETAARVAALMGGTIDATVSTQLEQTLDVESKAPGKFTRLADLFAAFPDIQANGLHLRQQWAQENPQLAHDLVVAIIKANRRVNDEPTLLYDESVKRLKQDPTIAKQVSAALLSSNEFDPNGALTQTRVQATLDLEKSIKAVPDSVTVDDVVDFSYVKAALDELGRR